MLGNLSDFDPQNDGVAYDEMLEIDRFALHRLQEIIAKTRRAYDTYEYHIIYHALYNYCTLDLSAFYLDILKDRLYTSQPASLARRSAQTAMYAILNCMSRLMAPILSFTAEEIWRYMPGIDADNESIHTHKLPQVNPEWQAPDLGQAWKRLLEIRSEVTKALEQARNQKLIGHPLDSAVTLSVNNADYEILKSYEGELSTIFIVSQASLTKDPCSERAYESESIEGLKIQVASATGEKCERCWIHAPSVGADREHPTICQRCRSVIQQITSGQEQLGPRDKKT
jgi:isoleucyl-tRNA synthetase